MEIQEYIDVLKQIQHNILQYLDNSDKTEEFFNDICKSLSESGYKHDYHEFKHILFLIIKISNHHYHTPSFYDKIDEILNYLKDQIKHTFSNYEIFNIFKRNKRLLLYFVESGIVQFDQTLYNIIKSDKYTSRHYPDYFYPEIKQFIQKDSNNKEEEEEEREINDEFYENRKKGENNCPLFQLIRTDSLDEFKNMLEKEDYSIDTTFSEPSIFETNPYFLKKTATLTEYAAYFGSLKIFNFLIKKNAKLDNFSTYCAVHGNNKEILKILVRKEFKTDSAKNTELMENSVLCHNNDIIEYVLKFVMKLKVAPAYCCISSFNFQLFPSDLLDKEFYVLAVKYDYIEIVRYFLAQNEIEFNPETILIVIFFSNKILNIIFIINYVFID